MFPNIMGVGTCHPNLNAVIVGHYSPHLLMEHKVLGHLRRRGELVGRDGIV